MHREDRFDARQLQPTLSARGGVFSTSHAVSQPHLTFDVGAVAEYAHRPVVIQANGMNNTVVGPQINALIFGSIGLFERLEFGLGLPATIYQSGDVERPFRCLDLWNPGGYGAGDIRLSGKLTIVDTASRPGRSGFSLGVGLEGFFPTGRAQNFVGGDFRFRARLLVTQTIDRHRISLNAGYTMRPRAVVGPYVVDDTVDASLATELALADTTSLLLEAKASLGILAPELTSLVIPVEAAAGARIYLEDLLVDVGASVGITDGFGTPTFRVFARVAYITAPSAPDPDDEEEALDEEPDEDAPRAPVWPPRESTDDEEDSEPRNEEEDEFDEERPESRSSWDEPEHQDLDRNDDAGDDDQRYEDERGEDDAPEFREPAENAPSRVEPSEWWLIS